MCIIDVATNDAHSIFVAISQVRISSATHNRSMHIMADLRRSELHRQLHLEPSDIFAHGYRISTEHNSNDANRLFLNAFPPYPETIEKSSRSRWHPRWHRSVQMETHTIANTQAFAADFPQHGLGVRLTLLLTGRCYDR
jgi:hypothetical protein